MLHALSPLYSNILDIIGEPLLTTSGSISWPSIMTELFASHKSGWIVHSMGVPVRKVMGNVIRPEKY